jgi:drug/metabolite transporter (DMT)-like permease
MVALTLTSVANVLVTMAVGPLLTALFARLFLNHRLPPRTWGAIAIASAGIAWMFGAEAARGVSLAGSLVALAVPVASSVNFTLLQQRAGAARDDSGRTQDMLPAVMLGALLSAAAMLPLAWPLQASNHDVGLLALLGVVQLAIPCLLEVIFGVLLAWLGAGEAPTASTLTGGALVLGALAGNELLGRRAQGLPLSR